MAEFKAKLFENKQYWHEITDEKIELNIPPCNAEL